MEEVAGWIAPVATMIAAMMTAANLGTRFTGWGFVVFAIGSIGWCVVAMATGQTNLLVTNAMLLIVNVAGIWRWLGRAARYEDGAKAAHDDSARADAPTLFGVGSLAGRKLIGRDGEAIGEVADAMAAEGDGAIRYVVVREGGVGGVGERLHAMDWAELRVTDDALRTDLTADMLAAREALTPGHWPARA